MCGSHKTIPKRMAAAAVWVWVGVGILLLLCVCGGGAYMFMWRKNAPLLPGVTAVPLWWSMWHGVYMVNIEVKGTPASCVFDTGSGYLALASTAVVPQSKNTVTLSYASQNLTGVNVGPAAVSFPGSPYTEDRDFLFVGNQVSGSTNVSIYGCLDPGSVYFGRSRGEWYPRYTELPTGGAPGGDLQVLPRVSVPGYSVLGIRCASHHGGYVLFDMGASATRWCHCATPLKSPTPTMDALINLHGAIVGAAFMRSYLRCLVVRESQIIIQWLPPPRFYVSPVYTLIRTMCGAE